MKIGPEAKHNKNKTNSRKPDSDIMTSNYDTIFDSGF